MGLAGAKQNTKIGKDPRNTHWSNDTSRFGHQHLVKLGWSHGKGLGYNEHGGTSHIKLAVKRDNTGLGAKARNPYRKAGDDNDDGFVQGLDVFQRILGRLNGEEARVARALDEQRRMVVEGDRRFGMTFVFGGLLQGTIDESGKIVKDGVDSESIADKKARIEKKRKRAEDEDDGAVEKKKKSKKDKKDKKEKKEKKEKKSKSTEDSDDTAKDKKKSKKEKKEKKDKKDKKSKKSKSSSSSSSSSSDKEQSPAAAAAGNSSVAVTGSAAPSALRGIHATRARWIRTKRAATMDAKSLGEIFMVS